MEKEVTILLHDGLKVKITAPNLQTDITEHAGHAAEQEKNLPLNPLLLPVNKNHFWLLPATA